MAAFNRTYRQKIVDEYMNDTGANSFVPAAFLEWLKPQTDHRVYSVFFGKTMKRQRGSIGCTWLGTLWLDCELRLR
jgi:hypothetical protein